MASDDFFDDFFDMAARFDAARDNMGAPSADWQTQRVIEYFNAGRDPAVLQAALGDAWRANEPVPTWLFLELSVALDSARSDRHRQKESTRDANVQRAWQVWRLRFEGYSITQVYDEAAKRSRSGERAGTFEAAWKQHKHCFPRPWVK